MKHLGFGDVISDITSSTDPDMQAGVQALQTFWQAAMPLNAQMPTDFPTFLQGLQAALVPTSAAVAWPGYVGIYYPNHPDQVFQLKVSGIGNMVNVGGTSSQGFFSTLLHTAPDVTPMTPSQVQSAMQALATQGGGKIPTDFNAFTAVLQNSAVQVDFLSALWYTVTATAGQVAAGAEQVGESVMNVGTFLNQYKTYLLIGGAALLGLAVFVRVSGKMPGLSRNPRKRLPRKRSNAEIEKLDELHTKIVNQIQNETGHNHRDDWTDEDENTYWKRFIQAAKQAGIRVRDPR